jgi:hypothetical protein
MLWHVINVAAHQLRQLHSPAWQLCHDVPGMPYSIAIFFINRISQQILIDFSRRATP